MSLQIHCHKLWIKLFLFTSTATSSWLASAQSIDDCIGNRPDDSETGISIANYTKGLRTLHLYHTNMSVTWCQAYHQCRMREGSSLIVIPDNNVQDEVASLIRTTDINNVFAWISARRKDFGNNGWTWVNEELDDCEGNVGQMPYFNCSNPPSTHESEFGHMIMINGATLQGASDSSGARFWGCKLDNGSVAVNKTSVKWYHAQNLCFTKYHARLMTFDEGKNSGKIDDTNHWNALQFRPWTWIYQDGTKAPMIFSAWNAELRTFEGEADCLGLDINSTEWDVKDCANQSSYFICEETAEPATTEASTTKDSEESVGGRSKRWKIGLGIGLGVGIAVVVAIVLGVYFGVCARKKKKNGSVSDMDNGKVNEGLDMKNETGEEGRTDGYGSNGFPPVANNYIHSDYDEINDGKQSSKNTPAPNTAPPPKPPRVEPDPAYTLATDPKKQVNIVGNPYIISPYSEVELNQFPTRNALDDNRGSRIMVDNTMYGGTIDHEPKQKPGILNKPPPGKPKAPEKPPKPSSLKKPQVAAITPVRHTLGPQGDEYAEIQRVDTIKK